MKLVFIRHGDPDYERDNLTVKGIREAELLAKRVATWDVRDFYCSPLGRAKATADFSMKEINRTYVVKDWLQEFFVPVKDPVTGMDRIAWDFMPAYWTKEPLLYDKERWVDAPVMQTGDIKNRYQEVCRGIDDLLSTYGYRRDGAFYRTEQGNEDTIVFFCHLGITFTILSHLLGVSPCILWQGFFVAPTSVTMLTTEERVKGEAYFRVKCMGDIHHLQQAEEPASDSGFFCETYVE